MAGETHTHNWALTAFVAADGRPKADIARDAQVSPQQLGDLISGRRAGQDDTTRGRLADTLGVDVRAITCWCDDRPGNHGGGGA